MGRSNMEPNFTHEPGTILKTMTSLNGRWRKVGFKSWGLLPFVLAVCILFVGPAGVLAQAITVTNQPAVLQIPTGQRQLFLDDFGIASIDKLVRTMHSPAKKGAVIRPNWERGETALQTRSAPVWDPIAGVFKLWMITSATHSGTTYAESEDGLHWRKPSLRQRAVDGSLENNTVTLDPTLEWPANAMENVVYDPDDPDPSRRFKGFAHCFTREPIASPDGIHWRKLKVPALASSDESNLSYDRQMRTFIATLKHGGPNGRSVFLSTSTDFEHWTTQTLMFHADDLDQMLGRVNIMRHYTSPGLDPPIFNIPADYHVDIYNMGVFRYEGLYVGLPSVYHKTGQVPGDWAGFADWDVSAEQRAAYRQSGDWAGFHHVQLACSRDLHQWQRLGDRRPFLDLSPVGSGAYDLSTIIGPSAPVVRGDELWFYYTGLKKYGGPTQRGLERDQGAICLAVLRRDGFISLDAGDKPGSVTTQPFKLPSGELHLNADALHGFVQAALLDANGHVRCEAQPMAGDQLRGKVTWTSPPPSADSEVRLRLTARHAALFSYWFE